MKIKGGMSRKAGREREGKRMKRKIATVRTENLFLLRPKITQNGRKEIRKNYEREERIIKKKTNQDTQNRPINKQKEQAKNKNNWSEEEQEREERE